MLRGAYIVGMTLPEYMVKYGLNDAGFAALAGRSRQTISRYRWIMVRRIENLTGGQVTANAWASSTPGPRTHPSPSADSP